MNCVSLHLMKYLKAKLLAAAQRQRQSSIVPSKSNSESCDKNVTASNSSSYTPGENQNAPRAALDLIATLSPEQTISTKQQPTEEMCSPTTDRTSSADPAYESAGCATSSTSFLHADWQVAWEALLNDMGFQRGKLHWLALEAIGSRTLSEAEALSIRTHFIQKANLKVAPQLEMSSVVSASAVAPANTESVMAAEASGQELDRSREKHTHHSATDS
jgi:hypothetical protein